MSLLRLCRDATKRFLDERSIDEAKIHAWLPHADDHKGRHWDNNPMCFATNCFLARRAWFADGPFRDYFDALDQTGGFYMYRWGDACVHMLGVAALLPPERTLHLTQTLPYWHQGTVVLPGEHRAAANELLAGTVKVPYEEDYSGEA